jgi:hypothetical protein
VELVVDGEKLHDLKMTVSESILDSAKVQAQGKNIKTGVVEAHRLTQHDPSPYASLTFSLQSSNFCYYIGIYWIWICVVMLCDPES